MSRHLKHVLAGIIVPLRLNVRIFLLSFKKCFNLGQLSIFLWDESLHTLHGNLPVFLSGLLYLLF